METETDDIELTEAQKQYGHDLCGKVQDRLKFFNDKPNTKDMRDAVLGAMYGLFGSMEKEGELLGHEVDPMDVAWNKMTTWDKLLWFGVNRIVPKVGKLIRDLHYRVQALEYEIDTETGTMRPQRFLPWWAEEAPWDIVVTAFRITVPRPVESIKFNFTI